MSLCEHGYTANWDCPHCECPCGSGKPVDSCGCVMAEAPLLDAATDDRAPMAPVVIPPLRIVPK